jgi:hypothetical protein
MAELNEDWKRFGSSGLISQVIQRGFLRKAPTNEKFGRVLLR